MSTSAPKLDTLQTVELAEGVVIRLRMAGPFLRLGAYLLDWLIKAAVLLVAGWSFSLLGLALGDKVQSGLMLLLVFVLEWLYPVPFEAGRRGATPGKRITGLRVVRVTGAPISLGQAFIRNVLRFVDSMPLFTYGFGLASCLTTRRFQRLGDLAAGTVVVYAKVPELPVLAQPPPIAPVAPPVGLLPDETRALVLFRERVGLWSGPRAAEIADQAAALSGGTGTGGVTRLLAMAHWVQEKRQGGGKR